MGRYLFLILCSTKDCPNCVKADMFNFFNQAKSKYYLVTTQKQDHELFQQILQNNAATAMETVESKKGHKN